MKLFEFGTDSMLRDIESEVRYTRCLIGKDALDARIMQAISRVPRNEFVPAALQAEAFRDGPLPIGHGQTISQPYIVALMTDLLELDGEAVVLEVGTGSGYQAAVLAELVQQVFSMEIIADLALAAGQRLERLGYRNVRVRTADGYQGWPEQAPFDGILVTAAATHIPPPLVEQLKPGARLVIPVGLPYMSQQLMVVEKDTAGATSTRDILGVAFVPLTRGEGGER
jgi:protein-L-isoaspartate(D-aspartate) O-methyltransferase